MSNATTNKTELIKSLAGELLKEYVQYDVLFRKEFVHQAPTDTLPDGKCLTTQFVYDGTTSRLLKKKETIGTWDANWDVN